MRGSWILWAELDGRPGYRNMAIDQALLGRAATRGERWLRLYRWAPGCLSFGRHEPAARRYDRDRAEALGLDTVRRPTGGRAVWHGEGLTYAVAVPSTDLGGVREVHHEIHRMLADALGGLGIRVRLAASSRAPGVAGGACFAAAVGGELMLGDRKVVGSAQLREAGGLLQHGSILLGGSQREVAMVTRGGWGTAGAEPALPDGPAVALTDLAEGVASAARARWGGRWTRLPHPGDLLAEASRHEPRFRSPAWTWAH